NIRHDALRIAAEQRGLEQEAVSGMRFVSPGVVEVVAVGRKTQRGEAVIAGRADLRIAVTGQIADPETVESIGAQYIEDVFAVGRYGDQVGVAGLGGLGDGGLLEWDGLIASCERVDAKRRCGEDGEDE